MGSKVTHYADLNKLVHEPNLKNVAYFNKAHANKLIIIERSLLELLKSI